MALTDLLKNAGRALTLTAALYNCGGEEKEGCSTDYDCREPRVCVRGYCEGGNGSEGEGEVNIHERGGDYPGYEGMCEDYIDLRIENGSAFTREHIEKKGLLEYCLETCSSPELIDEQRGETRQKCFQMFCNIQVNWCYDEGNFSPYIDCMQEQGYNVSICPEI